MPKSKPSKASSSRSTTGMDRKILTPRPQGQATVSGDAFYGSSSQSSRKEASAYSLAGMTGRQELVNVSDSKSDKEERKRPILTRTYKSTSSESKKKRRIAEESDEDDDDEQSSSERQGANMWVV